MQNLATTLISIDASLPLIDLDKITTIVAATYDSIASADDEKQFDTVGEPLEAFARLLKKQQKLHVLNIGCNVGWEASFLIARGFAIVGIDPSAEMAQKASVRVPQGRFLQMQTHELQFPPEQTFDAIWSTHTLIHIPKDLTIDLLASWKRVLKPGGILGIGVTSGKRNGWETTGDAPGRPVFYHYFTEVELEEALEAAGYQVLEKHERTTGGTADYFVFAQRSDTGLDRPAYLQYVRYSEDDKQGRVKPEDLEQVIALLLRTGSLTPREQLNLCLLYDRLANCNRVDEYRYKLTAQQLKLHLQTPETMSVKDFDLWLTMGTLQRKLTRFPQALSCLQLAHRLRPDHFDTLVELAYSYDGLEDLDKAIAAVHTAEQLAEQKQVSDEERADLYHALGHFYVSRSRQGGGTSIADREKGDHYMQDACKLEINYLGCLASIYNETKRYPE